MDEEAPQAAATESAPDPSPESGQDSGPGPGTVTPSADPETETGDSAEESAPRVLGREQVLEGRRIETVEVPELAPDGVVLVQPLPYAISRKIIEQSPDVATEEGVAKDIDVKEFLDDILIYGVIDENHERIFTEEDRERISNLPFGAAMRMARKVMEISGITEEGAEEIEGN